MASAEKSDPTVTIVVPLYNEERSCGDFLSELRSVLKSVPFPYEIVVVDDGSTDSTASIIQRSIAADFPVRLLRHETNRGKGAALMTGLAAVSSPSVIVIDGDGAFDPRVIPQFVSHLENNDIVLGVKKGYPVFRMFQSKVFNWYLRLLFSLPTPDAFCGIKAFRTEIARILFASLKEEGWLFDIEMLRRIEPRHRIRHQPVVVRENPDSKFRWFDPLCLAGRLLMWRLRDGKRTYPSGN